MKFIKRRLSARCQTVLRVIISAKILLGIGIPLTLLFFIVAAIAALVGIIGGWLTFTFMIRSRHQASHWRQRRRAGRRTLNMSLVTGLALSCSGVMCIAAVVSTLVENFGREAEAFVFPTPTPSPTVDIPPGITINTPDPYATPEVTDIPTDTKVFPTFVPSQTTTLEVAPSADLTQVEAATVEITSSPTGAPSATATGMATEVAVVSTRATLRLTALDDSISDTWEQVAPKTTFPVGLQRLYIYFSYADVLPDELIQKTLLRDGEVLMQQTSVWGMTPSTGETFFFFGMQAGFPAGTYEIRLTIGDALLASSTFVIQ